MSIVNPFLELYDIIVIISWPGILKFKFGYSVAIGDLHDPLKSTREVSYGRKQHDCYSQYFNRLLCSKN